MKSAIAADSNPKEGKSLGTKPVKTIQHLFCSTRIVRQFSRQTVKIRKLNRQK